MDLAHYGSDSEGDMTDCPTDPAKLPGSGFKRKRGLSASKQEEDSIKRHKKALPALPSAFNIAPEDDPTQHQGRQRARPFVAGEFTTHVYIALKIPSKLRQVLNLVLEECQCLLPRSGHPHPLQTLLSMSIIPPTPPSTSPSHTTTQSQSRIKPLDLHISLSHPLPLRQDQIQPFLTHMQRCFPQNLNHSRQGGTSCTGEAGAKGDIGVKGFRLSLAPVLVGYRNGSLRQSEGKVSLKGKENLKRIDKNHTGIGNQGEFSDVEENVLETETDDGHEGATRAFLALRVAAGHQELLRILLQAIEPFLHITHLPKYHSKPEFHTSFAWTLLAGVAQPLTSEMLASLTEKYEKQIVESQPVGGWKVSSIEVKTGKINRSFALQ